MTNAATNAAISTQAHANPEAGHLADPSRRRLLKTAGAAGLLLAVTQAGDVFAQAGGAAAPKFGGDSMPGGLVDDPLVFVSIAEDGIVTVVCHRSEMGQGVRTSWPMIVAEDLEADLQRVRVKQAPGDEARYGNQNTDGSRSVRHWLQPGRRVGAAARLMLEAAAAAKWGVPASEVQARNHELIHQRTGRKLGFGEVAAAAAQLPVPARESLKLKPASQFRYIGRSDVKLIDGRDIVTGRAQFGADIRLPEMVYAVVARPPVVEGKVKTYDAAKALQIPGVLKVVEIQPTAGPRGFQPVGGIAVVARNTFAAIRGRQALEITWDDGPNPNAGYDSAAFRKTLENAARAPAPKPARDDGRTMDVLAQAARKMEAEYYLPHLAHASMEPPVAVARIADGRCEVWAPIQAPQVARELVAGKLGLTPDRVNINVTLLGGGFGRKSKPDFIAEAALISKAMDGKPVKLQWTRDDDLQHDYYHTVAVQRLEAALDDKGMPTAWLHRSAAPTITSTFKPGAKGLSPGELGMTALNIPFRIPNIRVEAPEVDALTRIGWFRSVCNVPHAFGVQCFVAELAHAAQRDPKDYLLELLGPARRIDPKELGDLTNYSENPAVYPIDTGRMRRVIELAAQGAGWGAKLPKGQGMGIAMAYSFMSYAAAAIKVEVSAKGELRILSVDTAIDCGPQVNPERIRSQAEGAVIMGIGIARYSAITFKEGRAVERNFNEHFVPRHKDRPEIIRVHLAPSDQTVAPGGVGEPGLPPVAPALLNAIFAATGQRIRQLPIGDQLSAA
jgi:isoquinoline 1-oxidoreductase beta subunit